MERGVSRGYAEGMRFDTQLLKIRIKPGKTAQVADFIRGMKDRMEEALDALAREEMMVESFFLERHAGGDYLYYYVKARSIARANELHMRATDRLTEEIRNLVAETWADVASPEPLLDLDLIPARPDIGSRLPVQAPE